MTRVGLTRPNWNCESSIRFACRSPRLPLEFDDHLQLENADGSLRAQASIVALQYHNGHVAIAARFTAKPANWIIQA